MKSLTASTACVLLLGVAAAQELKFCGQSLLPYQEVTYTCVDDFLLCPVIAGFKYKRCGDSCYSDLQYNCTDDKILTELPQLDKSFQVAVLRKDLEFLDGQIINAVESRFVVGQKPNVDCPTPPLPSCNDFKNITVFSGTQPGALSSKRVSLDTIAPGGQQGVIEQSGLFGYSIPHSDFIPAGENNETGVFRAYKDGEFVFTGGKGWRACLVDDKGTLEIFQEIDGYQPKGLCIDIKLVTRDPGIPGPYAWSY
ncbi:hypothetical protein IWX90DRAFT_489274 [Phyllosticta citrichinensis]|uniref:Endo-1,3(4)-beta-glucanase 1 carbohydrate binding domain-containing protein n=1 Tax=Phyllosticta citrichinensis TaxID=1130410 RepID=A0ABR1XM22_9PEZI